MYYIDFQSVNRRALSALPQLLSQWLPEGKIVGREYVALNPKRCDQHLGSFKINLHNGKWSDFSTGDAGRDVISLVAYLFDQTPPNAARKLAMMLGGCQ